MLTVPAVRRLISTSRATRSSDFLWLDDVFITGILAIKAQVPLVNLEVGSASYFLNLFFCAQHLYEPREFSSVQTPEAPTHSRSRGRKQRISDYLIYGPGSIDTLNRSLKD